MNILAWIVFGLVTGVVANLIDPRPSYGGILGAIVFGIAGAIVGGFIGSLLFGIGVSGFNFESFIVAIAGSMLLLFGARALRRTA